MKKSLFLGLIFFLSFISACQQLDLNIEEQDIPEETQEENEEELPEEPNTPITNEVPAPGYNVPEMIVIEPAEQPDNYDLSDFPEPFVVNGRYDNSNAFVVGNEAPGSDSFAVVDIITKLQSESSREVNPKTFVDIEVNNPEDFNLVVIGNPCDNLLISQLDPSINCDDWDYQPGEAIVRAIKNGDKIALIISGTDPIDTRRAAKALANDFDFSGTEFLVTGTSLTDIIIENLDR